MKDIIKVVLILTAAGALVLGLLYATEKFIESIPGQSIEFSVLDHGVQLKLNKNFE